MTYRKLRIAWSVTWGIIALLLCVLWVRSYWQADNFRSQSAAKTRAVLSQSGWLYVGELYSAPGSNANYTNTPVNEPINLRRQFAVAYFDERPNFVCIAFPHWLLLLALTLVACAPWLRWRFRIRTLFIITSMAAALLGLISWASLALR